MTTGRAVVTGACSGIGLEIARELARRGHPLVLVSDREPELTTAAAELAAAHGVEIIPLAADLARPEAAHELYDEMRSRGLQVDILVSNAGVLFFGEVADNDPVRAQALLQLHVVTPSLLAHYFARDMRTRGSGHMLFTSSISAWRALPGTALYASSKRFLLSFAMSLREELHVYGVNVTCLVPGATATRLYEHTGVPMAKAIKYRVMQKPEVVARKAVKAMLRGKAIVVPGLTAKTLTLAIALTPRWALRLRRARPCRPDTTTEGRRP